MTYSEYINLDKATYSLKCRCIWWLLL